MSAPPSKARAVVAAVVVVLFVLAVWKFIEYRTQPPPPPHKIGELVETR